MSDWREYEFKAALSDLTPWEQLSVFSVVAARWVGRYVVRRRAWVVSEREAGVTGLHLIGGWNH